MKMLRKVMVWFKKNWYKVVAIIGGIWLTYRMFNNNRKISSMANDWISVQKEYYREMAEHARDRASLREIKEDMKHEEEVFVGAKKEIENLNRGYDSRRVKLWKRAYGKRTND